jgi:FkbM family methyltransferase
MLGYRSSSRLRRAITGRQHYVALLNMARHYPDFIGNLSRYLGGGGAYPYRIRVRTPIGTIAPLLSSHDDLLTVNEVFCRLDYQVPRDIRTVVDLGSNIGISALYFLTRNPEARCYLYEADVRNTPRLRANLQDFEARYHLVEKAVADRSGQFEFGIEATGRYGGIGIQGTETVTVDCVEINSVLEQVLQQRGSIDVLKLDIEGLEIATVAAIRAEYASRIRLIVAEARPDRVLLPEHFEQSQYGGICRLRNRKAS